MKLPKEEYRKAKGILKRYTYNCINILMLRDDIIGITGVNLDGMPHSKYNVSDIVLNSVIDLTENEELNKSVNEYKVIQKSLTLLDNDSKYIFEHLYEKKDMNKWDIINNLHISEETYKRRFKKLVYTVYDEFTKI